MTQLRCWRIGSVFLLSCASLSLCGCFTAFYPETYVASEFEVFQHRMESGPPCLDLFLPPAVCEATISRQPGGDYVVQLAFFADDESESLNQLQRAMTDSEVERMLAIFAQLRINRSPWPFCLTQLGIPEDRESFYRWDDFELVVYACDLARLDWRQAGDIGVFLRSLLPDQMDEAAETTDE